MQANGRKFILCYLMLFFSSGAFAQQINVTSNVKDALGEYVKGASVLVKGTTVGTITDYDLLNAGQYAEVYNEHQKTFYLNDYFSYDQI